MKKKLLFLIFLILLTGCYDRIELEQQSYVMAIGIDTTDQKGIYAFTYQIANPEVGSAAGQGGSDEPPTEIVTVNGADILSATYTANSFVSKQITLDHTKIITVSEELARDEDFLRVVQSASRSPQIRRGVQLVVTKENASDFINNNKPLMEKRPHKYYQFMLDRAVQTGIIPEATLHRFFQITEGDADLFLAIYATTESSEDKTNTTRTEDQYIAGEIPQIGGSPTQFMGSAVFKEGQMIDILNGEETRLAQMLDNTLEMDSYIATIPDPLMPDFRISYNYAQKEDPNINVNYHKDKPTEIEVKIPFQVEVIAIPSLIRYSQNKEFEHILKKSITRRLEDKTEALIKKSQEEFKSDPFYWSLYVRKHFKDVKDYEKADWNKKIYPIAQISVNYQLDKLEYGKMIDDSKLDKVRD
ncbi:Ger(x)C family spore germination protein [Gracilibacillus salitolerans]|uniref:Ger(X)C family spore germination protein n=1 Tax=Gracilibacillus salitolerans TaxID=2663022 RepID=A0A5Q2TGS3_9BACI|nr:Ger(x)C family spore germination protein [Gracilibacillus salitolerans]QGH32608.1 Ger(x)C family spore germination protein [Gracilibacillus salitolerans]